MPATLEMQAEALARAQSGLSMANYTAIYAGFTGRGISSDQITPRENVFTYNAWKAKGRQVRKGEKGVAIVTMVPMSFGAREADSPRNGQPNVSPARSVMRPRTAYVFHVSQTDPIL